MIRIFFLILLLAVPAHCDQIDTLISKEKSDQEKWMMDADTPPFSVMWGDAANVELYAPSAHGGAGNELCQPMEFDELVGLSRGNVGDVETILNFGIKSVRDAIQESCLIRPRDLVLAIGEGWQQRVELVDFKVKKDRPVCPQDSPYSLWGLLKEPLPSTPLFYSTSDSWPEGPNAFMPLVELKPTPEKIRQIRDALSMLVPDFQDYNLTIVGLHAANSEELFLLRRRTIDLNDDTLPNEMIITKRGDRLDKLWTERVDSKRGSGHIRIEGMLDYNRDGFIDLVVSGDHMRCPYKIIFQGEENGFSSAGLPIKPCVCW